MAGATGDTTSVSRTRLHCFMLRAMLVVCVLALLATALLAWLLMTTGGRDTLLARLPGLLPAGTELHWSRAEGAVSGPLVLHDLRYVQRGCPDVDGRPVAYGDCEVPTELRFGATRAVLDPAILPLLGRRLRLDALEVREAVLDLPVTPPQPFELPSWPGSLPVLELPLSLRADAIVVDGLLIQQGGAALIDMRSVRGGIDLGRNGHLHLEQVAIESDRGSFQVHGDYAPRDDYRMDLTASAVLPAPMGRTRPRIGLVARGDLSSLDVAVSGHVPSPLRVDLNLRGAKDPRWTFNASSDALDPGLLAGSGEPGTPIAFSLHAEGVGGAMQAQGDFSQGDLLATLQPSTLRIEEQVLEVERLAVDVFGGQVVAKGRGDFSDPADARFRFAVNAHGLAFGGAQEPSDPAIGLDADFGIAGRSDAWAAIGKAELTRDGQRANVDFDGRGNAQALRLQRLHVTMPTGTLDATGRVGWAPALGWDIEAALAGFDPGYFAPGWNGAVNGRIASTGSTRDDGGLDVHVDAPELGGKLRGRVLDVRARFTVHGAASEGDRTDADGEVDLRLGDSRIDATGTLADTLAVDARFAPLELADLLPDAAGNLSGSVQLSGPRNAPDVALDLDGSGLRWGDYRAGSLHAQGRLPWRSGNGTLELEARALEAGIALDSVRMQARGAIERLQLEANASGAPGTLALGGNAQRNTAGWTGKVSELRLAPKQGTAWRLQAPARFTQAGARWTLTRSCFATEAGEGALCASADWPRTGAEVDAQALPLALLMPYLPTRDDGRPWVLRGNVDLDAQVRPVRNALQGHVLLTSSDGGVRHSERSRRDFLGYRDLRLQAEFDARRIEATLATVFNEDGRIDARIATGWDAYSPLEGEIAVDTDELAWIELFSPDIVEPAGKLEGRLTLGGTRSEPALGGQARLSGFRTEMPALALLLEDGDVRLDALPDGSARIEGSVRSGEGRLGIDGSLDWSGRQPLTLNLRGSDVLLSDTRDLQLTAAPDISLRYSANQPLEVGGTVLVQSALMDLERLDGGVSVSPDVVVLDPVDPERGQPLRLLLDLTLEMGEDVRLRGFGLDGTLGGKLRVRAWPGREMTGQGRLEVGGTYKAYGQELRITRGHLVFSNGPVSDPLLDIRAERRIDAEDITAGIDVGGRASAPTANVWTDPASDSSQALSYLALGRSVSNLSSEEGRQLDAASAALAAGGSMLAGQLGSSIGLDDAGVMHSRALGGSVLGIGKQISPRVYIGFGVSLLGTGQVLTLKYLLRKGFDVEIESSTLESRGSVNWRHESN